jgi:hypothetical protein
LWRLFSWSWPFSEWRCVPGRLFRGALRRGADPDLALRVPFGWFSGAAESAGTTSRAPYAPFRGLIVARAVCQIIGRRRAVDYVLRSRGFEPAALGVHQGVDVTVERGAAANLVFLDDCFGLRQRMKSASMASRATERCYCRAPGFSGTGRLISRTGRSSSPGVAGRSRPSVRSRPCRVAALIQTFSSVAM